MSVDTVHDLSKLEEMELELYKSKCLDNFHTLNDQAKRMLIESLFDALIYKNVTLSMFNMIVDQDLDVINKLRAENDHLKKMLDEVIDNLTANSNGCV